MSAKEQPTQEPGRVAISTVAMSAYNWIAIQDGARAFEEILAGVRDWRAEVQPDELKQALALLVSKRLLQFGNAAYNVRDPSRRVVVGRDRRDPTGWSGWVVAKRDTLKRLPIEQAVQERN